MSTERMQQLIARACFGAEETVSDELDPKRLRIYRRLVRHNVVGVLQNLLPKTERRLEAIRPGAFARMIDAFLDEVGPRTPHLRDVPAELVAFAAPRWRADADVPAWLADHAELELLDFTIAVAPRPADDRAIGDVDAARPLVFRAPYALRRFAWAVNGLAEDREPEARAVAIFAYRDAEHVTRFLELSPLAAAMFERLLAGEPLGAAMRSACDAVGHVLDEAVVAGAAELLADLGERGVLLGAAY